VSEALAGLRSVLATRRGRLLALAGFAVALPLYLVTLPASFTGGRIGLVALRYLDAERALLALVMAAMVALLVALIGHQLRAGLRARKASASGGVALGVLAPTLCCSPALPIALASLATVFPSLAGAAGGRIQGFIATYQLELLALAAVLLGLAVLQNARHVARGACRTPPRPASRSGTPVVH